MVSLELKEKNCKFSLVFKSSEITNDIVWNDYINSKIIKTYLPKYGLIYDIIQINHDNLGNIMPDGSIKLNFSCLCKVFNPQINDKIQFNITNIIEHSQFFQYCYIDNTISIGVSVQKVSKQIGDTIDCYIIHTEYVDNKIFIIAQENI